MNKKHLSVLIAIIFIGLFFCCAASFAMEIQYPEINGITITDETTPTAYALYFFSIFLALGGVIAFLVLVSAGVKFMMAGGEPGKVSEAKNQIVGAFIGLIVLYSSYMILNWVNKDLLTVRVEGVDCMTMSVCVEKKLLANGKLKTSMEMSIPATNDNLALQPTESIIIKKYTGLKEIWGFSEPGFKGSVTSVWRATTMDLNETPIVDINLSSFKSYKIIIKTEGIYLYDKPNFQVGDGTIAPFIATGNVDDFNNSNPKFFNKTQSAEIITPYYWSKNVGVGAVFFSAPQFSGECYGSIAWTIDDFNTAAKQVGSTTGTFGYNIASLVSYHYCVNCSGTGETANAVFYNNLNCDENDDPKNICKKSLYGGLSSPIKFALYCNDSDFRVQSMKLSGPIGVVLIQGDRCRYFAKRDFTSGNCISSVLESQVPNADQAWLLPVDN
jgi:hypothetical protein